MAGERHYEKVICGCCFLFLCVNVGFPSTSFNVYQPYIVELVGDSAGSLILAVRTFVSLICMVFVARYYERFDCRLGIFLATLCTAAGFLIYGTSQSLPSMCLAAAMTGAGYGMGGFAGMTLVIGRWYKEHVGRALGIAAMGSGLASIVVPLLATWVIHNVSLSWSFRLQGIFALAVGLVVFLLLRNRPAKDGSQPHEASRNSGGDATPSATGQSAAVKTTVSGSRRRAMQIAMFCLGAISVDGIGYLSVLMTSSGFDPFFAAQMLSICGVCLTVAKLANGAIFDALGTRRGSVIFFAIFNAGLALCCLAHLQNPMVMAAAVVMVGIGTTLGSVGISMWCIDLSTDQDRAKLVRDLQVAYATGGFLFNVIPGPLMDLLGTYEISFALLTLCGLVSMVVVLKVYSSHAGKAEPVA